MGERLHIPAPQDEASQEGYLRPAKGRFTEHLHFEVHTRRNVTAKRV